MHFKDFNLNKYLLNALADLGYTVPTTIQQKTFSVVMSGADVCGIAQTGTGKTLAYLLPLLNQWKYSKEKKRRYFSKPSKTQNIIGPILYSCVRYIIKYH